MVLKEVAPGVTVEQVQAATGTPLIVHGDVPTMGAAT
jgi:acyl CoA:acetate/3-ketoacid CoA transferase beta subunit